MKKFLKRAATHWIPVLAIALSCALIPAACRLRQPSSNSSTAGTAAASSTWVAVKPGKGIQAAYLDRRTSLIWSEVQKNGSGKTEFTWSDAEKQCHKLKGTGSSSSEQRWRLPTRGDLDRAGLESNGAFRADGLFAFEDKADSSFGRSSIDRPLWTSTMSPQSKRQAWSALRLSAANSSFAFALRDITQPSLVRCVTDWLPGEEKTSSAALVVQRQVAAPAKKALEYETTGQPDSVVPSESRDKIVAALREKFTELKVPKEGLDANGSLILSSAIDLKFNDMKGGFSKSDERRAMTLLQAFAKTIAEHPMSKDAKLEFQIIGYSSPSFKGEPLEGSAKKEEGVALNNQLGLNRAKYIADMFQATPEAKAFSTKVFTRGASAGILRSSNQPSKCDPYDCDLSKRVEIRFILRPFLASDAKNPASHHPF